MKFFIVFYLFLISAPLLPLGPAAWGQVKASVRVESSVKPQKVHPQDVLVLTVSVEQEGGNRNINIQLPPLDDFNLIGESSSNSFQMIGGRITRGKKYHYTLRPKKEGVAAIGPVKAQVGQVIYKTEPVSVEVSSQVPRSRKKGGGSRFRFPFNTPFNAPGGFFSPFFDTPSPSPSFHEQDILFRLELSKKKAYIGELITAQWAFYIKENQINSLLNASLEPAELNNFWVEDVLRPTGKIKPTGQTKYIQGEAYKKYLLSVSAIAALKKGLLKIGPSKMTAQTGGGGGFGMFAPIKTVHKTDPGAEVVILPLPLTNKNKLFTSAVGDFMLSAQVSRTTLSVHDSFVYKIHFKGRGQTHLIRLPALDFGPSLKVYDQAESQKFSLSESIKDYELIMLPQKSGTIKIPSFELSTFDPSLGIYKVHILPSFVLQVQGHKASSTGGLTPPPQKHFKNPPPPQAQPPDFLQPQAVFSPPADAFYRNLFWMVLYGALLAGFLMVWGQRIFNPPPRGFKKTFLEFQKNIQQAEQKKQWKTIGAMLLDLLYLSLADLSGRPQAGRNLDVLIQDLPPGLRSKYAMELKRLTAQLEALSFAPMETGGVLRNRQAVLQLKNSVFALLKKINTSQK